MLWWCCRMEMKMVVAEMEVVSLSMVLMLSCWYHQEVVHDSAPLLILLQLLLLLLMRMVQ